MRYGYADIAELMRLYAQRLDDQDPDGMIDLLAALRRLPVHLRAVIYARAFLDLSKKAAAEALRVSERTVAYRYREALCQLSAEMNR